MSDVLPTTVSLSPTTAVVPTKVASVLPAPLRGEERLNLSRERMRLYLESAHRGKQPSRLAGRASRVGWIATLRSLPAVSASFDAVTVWWSRHPLRLVAEVAGGLIRPKIDARARQRPAAAMTLAVLAGAIAVWSRPWRWLFRPALFVGLLTQVAKRVVTEMPLESMLKVVGAVSGVNGAAKRRTTAVNPR